MKLVMIAALMMSPVLASCAHPIEGEVEAQRLALRELAYRDRPVSAGAADSLGMFLVDSGRMNLVRGEFVPHNALAER